VAAAERSQQKEVRISIQEARELITELAIITSKLGKTVQEIHQSLKELKETSNKIDVKFDGGSF
jgi:urease gamma subunit